VGKFYRPWENFTDRGKIVQIVGIIEKNWNSMVPQSVDNIVRHSMAP
jgi:hypothetical protein